LNEVYFINEGIISLLLILHHHYRLYSLGLFQLMLSHAVKESQEGETIVEKEDVIEKFREDYPGLLKLGL